MNKRIVSILVSLVVLAISVTLLLVFMLGKNNNNDAESDNHLPLNCLVYDLNISVGEKVYDYYEVNDKTAIISFSVDNNDIIDINKDYIEGKKVGKVTVTINLSNNKEQISKSFIVEVFQEGYKFKIYTYDNCEFIEKDGNLIVYNDIASFGIEIYDLMDNKIENSIKEFYYDKNKISIINEFGTFQIFDIKENCKIDFECLNIDFKFSINIIISIS